MDIDPEVRIRQLRAESWALKHKSSVPFPKSVRSTKCKTVTHSVIEHTPHGVIRKEIITAIDRLLPLSEYKLDRKN